MNVNRDPISPEDYVEPRCLLCGDPFGAEERMRPIPQQRIIEKMDEYMSRRDYPGAERHLLYWLEEAKVGGDRRGEFFIYGELVGHYRKTGEREKAFDAAENELRLLRELGYDGTVSAGTACVNVATAYSAFGENERALELFRRARENYEKNPSVDPALLGGLFNNMGLVCVSLSRFREADDLYRRALSEMEKVKYGELELAITYLNMANAVEAELGLEEGESRIFDLLDRAKELLDKTEHPRDGYYAFVCEKCAPTFGYYGYFADARDLSDRAEAIYEDIKRKGGR